MHLSPPPKSIVLVDDDGPFLKMLGLFLSEGLACPVVTYVRPRDALAALPRINPGIIVTDYEMPEMNGFEFTDQASKLVPDVPIVLITGHVLTAAMQQKIDESPLAGVLAKPFRWQNLADELARHWPESAGPLLRDSPASV